MNFSSGDESLYKRLISLNINSKKSIFLWGTRQTGKSTLLKSEFPEAIYIDLLKSDLYVRYLSAPKILREELSSAPMTTPVIIDEVQKIPQLLDEVHWLIENKGITFILCGSSARKLKRGHANLLGGRAMRYELFGLVSRELASDFDLIKLVNRGYLPSHYLAEENEIKRLLLSYVGDYLKEEIAAESLVRNIAGFHDFLAKAALSDAEIISYSSFARDVGVSANTIKEYYSILVDTLIGWLLPAYTSKPKRRTVVAPKFYFGDVGIVNHLAQRGAIKPGSELFGKAFENWVSHELRAFNHYADRFEDLAYWRLTSGVEVDFIVGKQALLACEAKASSRITSDHLRGLREFKKDFPKTKKALVVSLEESSRLTEDNILILSVQDFVKRLWDGELF